VAAENRQQIFTVSLRVTVAQASPSVTTDDFREIIEEAVRSINLADECIVRVEVLEVDGGI
jgi:hypothetical protein